MNVSVVTNAPRVRCRTSRHQPPHTDAQKRISRRRVRFLKRDVCFAETDVNIELPERECAQAKYPQLPCHNQISQNSAC